MPRRINKNQYGYRHPQEEIERTRATAYRAPRRISPAQMAAQSYVKSPLQLGLTTIGRRAERAYPSVDEFGNAMGNVIMNTGGVFGAPVKSGLKAYFQNANDKGELKDWSPVLSAMEGAAWQQASQLPASFGRFGRATMNAREPVQDFLGGIGELGYSGLYGSAKAIQRQSNKSVPAMYQNTRNMIMPFLQDDTNTGGSKSTNKRATMCKCGSGMAKSMCKCGANDKSSKRSSRGGRAVTKSMPETFNWDAILADTNPQRNQRARRKKHAPQREGYVAPSFTPYSKPKTSGGRAMMKSTQGKSSSRIHPAQQAAMYDASKTWERKQKADAAQWAELGSSPWMTVAEMIRESIPGSTKGGGPFIYIKGANLAWSKKPGSISGKQSATTKRLSKRQAGPKPNKYM